MNFSSPRSVRTLFLALFFILSILGLALYIAHLLTGFSLDRVMFRPFGLFSVYWSGVVLLFSFGVGYGAAMTQPAFGMHDAEIRRVHRPLTFLLLGWIGARLFDIIFISPTVQAQGIQSAAEFFANPIFLIDLNWGGLNVWGAIVFVGGWLIWFCWRKGLPASAIFYKTVVGFLIGLSLMQWGHFVSQQLYGYPWDGWGSLFIDPTYRLPQFLDSSHFVPMFLFAALWYFVGAIWLLFDKRWQESRRGQINGVLVGLLWFVVGRLFIELATPNSLVNWLPASLILIVIFTCVYVNGSTHS